MFTRTRYQNGSLRVKSRENGLRVWEFRYYEPLADGTGRNLRAATVGTLQQYPSELLFANRQQCRPLFCESIRNIRWGR